MTPDSPAPSAANLCALSGLCTLPRLGVIRALGADAASFLQGQLTQDVLSLGAGQARLAAFCNAKGRMQASFIVFQRSPEEWLLVCSHDLLATTLKRLAMFVMRAKAKLSDATADFVLCGVAGVAIDSIAHSAHIAWSKDDLDQANLVHLYPGAGTPRALWCAPVGTALPQVPALDQTQWDWLEVQAGIAMVTQPLYEALVPQMLNYESVGGVSFKKGCYPGQEIIARSQFRGTLKRRAYVVHTAGTPAVGQEVFQAADAEQPCGLVAAFAPRPTGGFDALVSLQIAAAEAGGLTLGSPDGAPITLLPLPYPLLEDL